MVETKALSANDRAAQVFPPTVPPDQARAQNQTTGPNGLIERQVTKELMELFNIDEQTLNTQGLQITTTIDPKAQQAAEKAVSKYLDGQDPDMRAAVVSIDPHNGAVRAYYGGSDAERLRLRPGRAADRIVVQGVRVGGRPRAGHRPGLPGRQLAADRRRHQDHQRRRRELWHLQYRRGAQDVAEHRLLPADAQAQERTIGRRPTRHTKPASRPASPASPIRCPRTARADHPTTGLCWASTKLGRSTWPRRTPRWPPPASTTRRIWCRRSSMPTAKCFSTPATRTSKAASSASTRRSPTTPPRPCSRSPAYSRGHALSGGRPSAAKTGTVQLGDTDANKDAWMVGYTPSLSTAVWVGTVEGNVASGNRLGRRGLRFGPAVRHLEVDDGRRPEGHRTTRPSPSRPRSVATPGVPAPRHPPPPPPSETVIQPSIEVAPGITIPRRAADDDHRRTAVRRLDHRRAVAGPPPVTAAVLPPPP